jgi:hypothetical protein
MTLREMANSTPEIVKIIVGGIVTLALSLIVHLNSSKEIEDSHIEEAIAKEKVRELGDIAVRLDSLLRLERAERIIFNDGVKRTVDSLIKTKTIQSKLTDEILKNTITNPSDISKKEREEIYKELQVYKN